MHRSRSLVQEWVLARILVRVKRWLETAMAGVALLLSVLSVLPLPDYWERGPEQ